jgi:hypothetical protein
MKKRSKPTPEPEIKVIVIVGLTENLFIQKDFVEIAEKSFSQDAAERKLQRMAKLPPGRTRGLGRCQGLRAINPFLQSRSISDKS